jgi:hypothetical protein
LPELEELDELEELEALDELELLRPDELELLELLEELELDELLVSSGLVHAVAVSMRIKLPRSVLFMMGSQGSYFLWI